MISPTTPDLAPERIQKIADILSHERVVRVADLTRVVGASPATIRRDLTEMQSRGMLRKVHGGAVAAGPRIEEPLFDDKTTIHADEKRRIARKALEFIGPRESIFLDGGSTVLALAGLLQEMKHLTVVTNSLRVAQALSGTGPRVIVIGGELRSLSQTFVGPLTGTMLEHLHVDVAFMGTIALAEQEGMTTTDPREAYTKQRVMAHAHRVILMADGSKIGTVSFVGFGDVSDIDTLITDNAADRKLLQRLKRQGINIVTA